MRRGAAEHSLRAAKAQAALVLYGLVQWLQFEDRVLRRQIVECFHCRPLRNGEEALHLAGEAVKIALRTGGGMLTGSSRTA